MKGRSSSDLSQILRFVNNLRAAREESALGMQSPGPETDRLGTPQLIQVLQLARENDTYPYIQMEVRTY